MVRSRPDDDRILDEVLGEGRDKRTMREWVTDRLRQLIVEGRLPPGMPLRPVVLAERLGVSPMPVREALRVLESEGLVSIVPRRGTRVVELSIDDVEEMYAVRSALEALAAPLVARAATETDVAELRDIYERMSVAQQRGDLSRFLALDRWFHERMYAMAQRPQLADKIMSMWDNTRRSLSMSYEAEAPMMVAALRSHADILSALEARDPDAAEAAVLEHTRSASSRVVGLLRTQGASRGTKGQRKAATGPGRRTPGRDPAE